MHQQINVAHRDLQVLIYATARSRKAPELLSFKQSRWWRLDVQNTLLSLQDYSMVNMALMHG